MKIKTKQSFISAQGGQIFERRKEIEKELLKMLRETKDKWWQDKWCQV